MTISIDNTETTIDHPMITVDGAIIGNPDAVLLTAGKPITRTNPGSVKP